MDDVQAAHLAQAISDIQQRWGSHAILKLRDKTRKAVSTSAAVGFPTLDAMLAPNGIARGHITELLGKATAGRSIIALKAIKNAQRAGDFAAYMDFGQTFDASYAARSGVDLKALLLVRPPSTVEGFEIAAELISRFGAGMVILDQTFERRVEVEAPGVISIVNRLSALVRQSSAVIVYLAPLYCTTDVPSPLHAHTTLTLEFERLRWIRRYGSIRGYKARVGVVKHKFGLIGRETTIDVVFDTPFDGA